MDTNMLWTLVIGVAAVYLTLRLIGNRKASRTLVGEKLAEGAVIVDVRTRAEFASGAYPKARNIPLDALATRLGELPKGKPIVLYCASGAVPHATPLFSPSARTAGRA